jgi:predicted permease
MSRSFRRSLRITRSKPDPARDVAEELEFYLEERTRELIESGMDPAEAAQEARAAFGDRQRIEQDCLRKAVPMNKRQRRMRLFSHMYSDVRFALRGLLKRPGFTVVALLTLVLCIGANSALFSVVNAVLLRPLPFPDSQRIVSLHNAYPLAGVDRSSSSARDYLDRREGIEAFEAVAEYSAHMLTVGSGEASQTVLAMLVTPEFFPVLGVEPVLGRKFTQDDCVLGQEYKVIISEGLWQQQFGGVASVLGGELDVEGVPMTVVGVMPGGFDFSSWHAQIWIPLVFTEADLAYYHNNTYNMIARLKPGASVEEAQSQVDALNATVTETLPTEIRQLVVDGGFRTPVQRLSDDLARDFRAPILLLWGAVAFVLIIGCLNLANLLLVRATARLHELGTRYVLGATRWRVGRQLLTESVVLTLIGGGLGLALGTWSLGLLEAFDYLQIPRVDEVRMDGQAALFTLGLSALVGLIVGTIPAVVANRQDLYSVFRGGGPTGTDSGRSAGKGAPLRNTLVVAQVALAFMLLIGGGLLFTSLRNVLSVDPGFDTRRLLVADMVLPSTRYEDDAARIELVRAARESIAALPGVHRLAVATQLPFSGRGSNTVLSVEGRPRQEGDAMAPFYQTAVTSGYFETMGIPLLAGRDFRATDIDGAGEVALVDERMAQVYWPDESPLGKRFTYDIPPTEGSEWVTIVGVVGNVVQNDLANLAPQGAFYRPYAQSSSAFLQLAIRTDSDPLSLLAPVREKLRSLDPDVTFFNAQTMSDSMGERLIPRRLPMLVLTAFAGVALFLSSIGLYGVLAYSVSRRTKEIGIRIALGSSTGDLYGLVLRRGLAVVAIGLVIGIAGALASTRLLTGFLFEVEPTDPVVYGAVALLTLAVALLACVVPVRRAIRVNPVVALNSE